MRTTRWRVRSTDCPAHQPNAGARQNSSVVSTPSHVSTTSVRRRRLLRRHRHPNFRSLPRRRADGLPDRLTRSHPLHNRSITANGATHARRATGALLHHQERVTGPQGSGMPGNQILAENQPGAEPATPGRCVRRFLAEHPCQLAGPGHPTAHAGLGQREFGGADRRPARAVVGPGDGCPATTMFGLNRFIGGGPSRSDRPLPSAR